MAKKSTKKKRKVQKVASWHTTDSYELEIRKERAKDEELSVAIGA